MVRRAGSPRERAMDAHPSAGRQKLKVLVTADPDLDAVRIIVHGCVSPVNIHGLDLVVRRAASLAPRTDVTLDLGHAQAWDAVNGDLEAASFTTRLAAAMPAGTGIRLHVIPPGD